MTSWFDFSAFRRGSLTVLARHQDTFWWLHSAWALGCGMAVMWVGARHFAFVRIAVLYVAAIWLASLLTPWVLERPRLVGRARWVRLAINYVSRNFYQQVLFFVLPIYYASATRGSANLLFVGLVALSALVSSLDLVYDRHLSTNRNLVAVFFALNLFVCLTAALPILWHVGPSLALRISAALAFVGFVSFYVGRPAAGHAGPWIALLAVAVLLAFIATHGQRLIPPVPMRLAASAFGDEVDRTSLQMARRFERVPAGWSGTLDVVTAIRAPMGLTEAVRHRWSVDGVLIRTTDVHQVNGGRKEGFRLWTALRLSRAQPGSRIAVDVETFTGQIVGRARIQVDEE